jgi:hypothetical protein
MPSTLSTSFEWAEELLDVASAALLTTEGGAIPRAFVAAGLPALDCCPQLTVHVAGHGLLPTTSPGSLGAGHHRTTGYVRYVRFIITVVRCAPVPTGKAKAPTPAAQAAIAAIVSQDAPAIISAVIQADAAGLLFDGTCREFYFDGATSLDPAGGCVGWTIGFRASIEGLGGVPAT